MSQSSDEHLVLHFSGKQTACHKSERQRRAVDSKGAFDSESSWF